MSWDLRGKTVLITGAARGIGAESARRAAAAGANVALVGLEPQELERVAAQCGSNAAAFECDVTDWDALERAVEGALERFGGIDVVMANAGIAPAGMTRSIDPRAFERTVEVKRLGVDVGVAYFGFIDTDMVRGADSHPGLGRLRKDAGGLVSRTYPVSAVGK